MKMGAPFGIGETMLYIEANKNIPTGVVSSSARLGRKWFDTLAVGEVFRCVNKDTGALITRAVCVKKELVSYREVLLTAYDNHVAFEHEGLRDTYVSNEVHSGKLRRALEAAYGQIASEEAFSKIHLLPILDFAEDRVLALYHAAHWSPDRKCDSERLWANVADAFGFNKATRERSLGPRSWVDRLAALQETATKRRRGGELSIEVDGRDYASLIESGCIEWLRMPNCEPPVPTFMGLVVDRLES